MNIEQVKELKEITKSKTAIELLLDKNDFIINSIIDSIRYLKYSYEEDELRSLIEELIKYYENDIEDGNAKRDIMISMLGQLKKLPVDEITEMLKFYREEGYKPQTRKTIKLYRADVSKEDFFKLYNSLKKKNFSMAINKYTYLTNESRRTINEICALIEEDNGLSPKQIEEIYFDKDMVKHRTFEESKMLGDKVIYAYQNEEYKEKVEKDSKVKIDDIDYLAVDGSILSKLTCSEQLELMDIYTSDPSNRLFKILINRDIYDYRTFDEIKKLIELYKKNNELYIYIVNHKLIKLPLSEQLEYIELLQTKSQYLRDRILNSDEELTSETLEELRLKTIPVSIKEELLRSKSIDDFIKSLENNGTDDFNSSTMIYTKTKRKQEER